MAFDLSAGWESQLLTDVQRNITGGKTLPSIDTASNRHFLDIWTTMEGGAGLANSNAYNPLNTGPGGGGINHPYVETAPGQAGSGLAAFPDQASGLQATADMITQSNMATIVTAFLDPHTTSTGFGQAVEATPWARSHYNYQDFGAVQVAGPVAAVAGQSSGGNWWDGITGLPGAAGNAIGSLYGSEPLPGQQAITTAENVGAALNNPGAVLQNAASGLLAPAGLGAALRKWGVIALLAVGALLLVLELFRGESSAAAAAAAA